MLQNGSIHVKFSKMEVEKNGSLLELEKQEGLLYNVDTPLPISRKNSQ